jgi:hypothetical protein
MQKIGRISLRKMAAALPEQLLAVALLPDNIKKIEKDITKIFTGRPQ